MTSLVLLHAFASLACLDVVWRVMTTICGYNICLKYCLKSLRVHLKNNSKIISLSAWA